MDIDDFIYLDNQATTPVDKRIIDRMFPYLNEVYGNPNSNDHYFGWRAKHAVDMARTQVASFLNVDANEVIFTSGATEANNLAILGILPTLKSAGKTKIIVSAFEHKCILESAKISREYDIDLVLLQPEDNGVIDPVKLQKIINENVGLVSIMAVNNEIGTIQPIKKLCHIAHTAGAFFHTDATQAALFMDLDVTATKVDFLSLSAHKIYGPKGIGCLYIKREFQRKISPLLYGGGQEAGLRSGTVPTMLCVGFGEACYLAKKDKEKNSNYLKNLSSIFWNILKKQYSEAILNGCVNLRHPGNLNIRFPGYDAHSLLQILQPIVAASTGSACNTRMPEPSYVLKAIGLTNEEAANSIRFSFGLQNTEEQVKIAAQCVISALSSLAFEKATLLNNN